MNNKSSCNPAQPQRATDMNIRRALILAGSILMLALPAVAGGEAPQWMHAVVNAPLPEHDEKTDAVLMYSEKNMNVISADKIKTHVRMVYKILRPSGREYGTVMVPFNAHSKISNLRGWCIPAQGKDYEIKDKDGYEVSLPRVENSELVSDVKAKILQIPAPDPGNIVGYEYDEEEQPMVLQDVWHFQREIPSREAHFSLQIPQGWVYKSYWINYPETKPSETGTQLEWTVKDIKGIRAEAEMPPIAGVEGQLVVSYFPPGGPSGNGFSNWQDMGKWYVNLTNGRRDPSPQITQQVNALTSTAATRLEKMRVLAQFVQHDVRYVAIELGIGGWQPHPASEIFNHHYGDCKDKATLLSSMLSQIGVESFYVLINTERGVVLSDTPARIGFDHAIIAIKVPPDVPDGALMATIQHPRLGRLLFFDPTNDLTPFGEIGGYLQQNYGLLVTPEGGELVELPRQAPAMNSIARTGKLALDASGTLTGQIDERRLGDRAATERYRLRNVSKSSDQIKPIEDLMAGSLSLFQITHANLLNLHQTDQPFGFQFSFVAQNYAKNAGGLLLVRPRVLGVKAQGFLETKEPRRFSVEFPEPFRDTDSFDISIPAGYVVDDVPPAIDADYSFASYHSKTEVKDNLIHYSRTFELKELSVPVSRVDELKKFYRIVAGDERSTVVLKASQ